MSRITKIAEKIYFNWIEKEIELLLEKCYFFRFLVPFHIVHILRNVVNRFALEHYGHQTYPQQLFFGTACIRKVLQFNYFSSFHSYTFTVTLRQLSQLTKAILGITLNSFSLWHARLWEFNGDLIYLYLRCLLKRMSLALLFHAFHVISCNYMYDYRIGEWRQWLYSF